MIAEDRSIQMRPEEYRLLQEFVEATFGLVLDGSKDVYLAPRLLPRMKELGLTSFYDYYSFLKFSPQGPDEQRRFISLITNNETYFFREEAQLRVFAEQILPLLKQRKVAAGARRIRIVSAGCSTGEEVYTLAMLLVDSGAFIWDWDIQVVGIDIDEQVLEKAQSGLYSGRVFQTLPEQYCDRYFRKTPDGLLAREVLRKIVSFRRGNLLEFGEAVAGETIDIIFCRNVLIYFSEATVKRIVESFGSALSRDGYLFLGHSESLSRITAIFQPVRYPGAIVYRLREHMP